LFERKYGFVFRSASYPEVPFASKGFSDESIIRIISNIEGFLLNTFVIDMKTNVHKEMHDLRYSFTEDEYNWHQTHNKLGAHRWGTFFLKLMRLNELLKRDDLHLSPRIEKSFHNYNGFTFDEKVAHCTEIDTELYRILEILKKRKNEPEPKKIAISTEDILEWPGGDIETKKIAAMLLEAHEKSLPDSAIVQYCKSQRVKDWDPEHQEYETITRKKTVGQLKRWYRDVEGYDFDPEQHKYDHVNNQFAVFIYHNPQTGVTDLVTLAQD
jgi:hypothetical protein